MREGDTADTLGGATQYRNTRNLMASSALCRNTRTCCSCSGSRRHRQHVGRSDALGEERRTGGGATHWGRSDALEEERGGATHWGRSDALGEERRTGGGATHWGRSDALGEEPAACIQRRCQGRRPAAKHKQRYARGEGGEASCVHSTPVPGSASSSKTHALGEGGRGVHSTPVPGSACQRVGRTLFGRKQDPTHVTLQLFNQNSDPCI